MKVLKFGWHCVRLIVGVPALFGVLLFSGFSLIAYLGFVFPLADAFSHFQSIWFFGLIAGLIALLLFLRTGAIRNSVLVIGFIGLALSGTSLIDEGVRGLTWKPSSTDTDDIYTVMSRNLFGLNYDMEAVFAEVERINPDVLALQEYYIEQSSRLHPLLVQAYPHIATCTGGHRAAIAVYSKIPFQESDLSVCPETSSQWDNQVAQIVVTLMPENGAEWTLVNTHLNWPVQISALRRQELGLFEKLGAMTARKDKELVDLAQTMQAINGPSVVLGDFNSTPWSYQLNNFAKDAGVTRHSLNMPSFPARFYIRGWRETLPFLPLDHMFTGNQMGVNSIELIPAAGSDHLAIAAEISVPAASR